MPGGGFPFKVGVPMPAPDFECLSLAPLPSLVRYAEWLGVPTTGIADTGAGRHALVTRIARARKQRGAK